MRKIKRALLARIRNVLVAVVRRLDEALGGRPGVTGSFNLHNLAGDQKMMLTFENGKLTGVA